MRVLKPQRLSLLQRIFEIRGERYLALGAATYATFEAPNRPLAETELWADLPSQLGAGQVLDEGLPKPRGEVLVFGRGFVVGGAPASHRVRLQAGPVDKSVEVQTERGYALGLLGPRDVATRNDALDSAPTTRCGSRTKPLGFPRISTPTPS